MLFELDKQDFNKALPLYLGGELIFPLILAVIQRKQHGWIYADNALQPAALLVITKFGFTQFTGGNFDSSFVDFWRTPKRYLPTYVLWYSPPAQAREMLDRLPEGKVRRRERVRFAYHQKFSEDHFDCPPGFQVRYLDKELIEKTRHFKLEIGSRFWESTEDFLENGIGACVMKAGEIVSLCYSACVVNNLAEVDVVTQEGYRGMGIATLAAQGFIAECLRRGITPTWDCFTNNTASMKLARKLGFEEQQTYYLYSFNLPVHLVSS